MQVVVISKKNVFVPPTTQEPHTQTFAAHNSTSKLPLPPCDLALDSKYIEALENFEKMQDLRKNKQNKERDFKIHYVGW